MTKLFVTGILISIVSLRCSHTATTKSSLPPFFSHQFREIQDKDAELTQSYFAKWQTEGAQEETQYWIQYKLAQVWSKSKKEIACDNFSKLAKNKSFPLHELAYIRSLEFCENKEEGIEELFSLDPENIHSWLRGQIYELRYTLAKKSSRKLDLAKAAIAKSKLSLVQKEKVELTQEALALAIELKETELAKEYEDRLIRLAPRFKKEIRKEDYLEVAYDYRRERNFDQAIKLYKKVANNKKSSIQDRVKAWKGIERSYKLSRDKEKNIKSFFSLASLADNYYRNNKSSSYAIELHHDTQIGLARALWTLGQTSKARAILETLVKWLNKKYPLDQAYWLIARMEEEKARFESAVSFAEKSIAQAKPKSEFRIKSLWIVAWNQRKLTKYPEAIKNFEILLSETENIYEARKFKYWLANTYGLSGDNIKSYQLLKELSAEDPQGYYGLLSYRERGEAIPPLLTEGSNFKEISLELSLSTQAMNKIYWLIALDELELAQNFLDQQGIHTSKEEELEDIFSLYSQASHYAGIFRSLSSLEPEVRQSLLDKHPEYLFPRPDYSVVQEASARYGVSPSLVYSIIRQESSFIPHARSQADAYGLMQLIPKQAERIARKQEIPYSNVEDLYKAHVNIPLGCYLLRELWEKHRGQFVISVASYNASEKAVIGWVNTRFTGDPISFIEDIPYEETKSYVKLVLRNFIYYQRLEDSNAEYLFPTWVFEGLEKFKR